VIDDFLRQVIQFSFIIEHMYYTDHKRTFEALKDIQLSKYFTYLIVQDIYWCEVTLAAVTGVQAKVQLSSCSFLQIINLHYLLLQSLC